MEYFSIEDNEYKINYSSVFFKKSVHTEIVIYMYSITKSFYK